MGTRNQTAPRPNPTQSWTEGEAHLLSLRMKRWCPERPFSAIRARVKCALPNDEDLVARVSIPSMSAMGGKRTLEPALSRLSILPENRCQDHGEGDEPDQVD